uniref:hypothetical protein n=1 Tax=uncultured Boseongicola sp. TaxID=1648499 RepID=UPI00262A157A
AVQIASKAKHVGRIYQHMLIQGDDSANGEFDGLAVLCASGQKITPSTNGDKLDFDMLDALSDLVTAKDGALDYFLMHARERRAYRALLRGLGGAAIMEVVEMPSGEQVLAYSGTPVFRNDFIPQNVSADDAPAGRDHGGEH